MHKSTIGASNKNIIKNRIIKLNLLKTEPSKEGENKI